jgi:hypothetical protein
VKGEVEHRLAAWSEPLELLRSTEPTAGACGEAHEGARDILWLVQETLGRELSGDAE